MSAAQHQHGYERGEALYPVVDANKTDDDDESGRLCADYIGLYIIRDDFS